MIYKREFNPLYLHWPETELEGCVGEIQLDVLLAKVTNMAYGDDFCESKVAIFTCIRVSIADLFTFIVAQNQLS